MTNPAGDGKPFPVVKSHGPPPMKGARCAEPIMKADHVWTQFETWLAVLALSLEILSMSLWVFLKGFSTPTTGDNQAGVVFRSVVGATIFGMTAYFGLKKQSMTLRRRVTVGVVILGVLLGTAWAGLGVALPSKILH